MHFSRTTGLTQGLLLGDWFKRVMIGVDLSPDLSAEVRQSRFFAQYAPSRPLALDRPNDLPDTSLAQAFRADTLTAAGQAMQAEPTLPPNVAQTATSVAMTATAVTATQAALTGTQAPADVDRHRVDRDRGARTDRTPSPTATADAGAGRRQQHPGRSTSAASATSSCGSCRASRTSACTSRSRSRRSATTTCAPCAWAGRSIRAR